MAINLEKENQRLERRIRRLERQLGSFEAKASAHAAETSRSASEVSLNRVRSAVGLDPSLAWPRLLVLDASLRGDHSATGQLLDTLLQGWPDANSLQLSTKANKELLVHGHGNNGSMELGDAIEAVREFDPELVWFRPDARSVPLLHVYDAIRNDLLPLCLSIVDNWVERAASKRDSDGYFWEMSLERLVAESTLRFAISPEMAKSMGERYGREFDVVSNIVDLSGFPETPSRSEPSVLRFHVAGQLANQKGGDSVMSLAMAVEGRSHKKPKAPTVELHARTPHGGNDWWYVQALRNFGCFEWWQTSEDKEGYYRYLSDGDVSVMAFNFDEGTRTYLVDSFANRMPELLAAGRPILAIGPPELASVRFVAENDVGIVVPTNDVQEIEKAVSLLAADEELRVRLGRNARRLAQDFDVRAIRPAFHAKLLGATFVARGELAETRLQKIAGSTSPRGELVETPDGPAISVSRPSDGDISKLKALTNKHLGERCVVIGNGPSLNDTDLSLLEGEYIFGSNGIYLLFDEVNWRPQYYASVDSRFLPDRGEEVGQLLRDNPEMTGFFPSTLEILDGSKSLVSTASLLPELDNRVLFWSIPRIPAGCATGSFSLDASRGMIQPSTVTVTLLQLAAHMGFSEIVLIGCDTSYSIPKTVEMTGPVAPGQETERMLLKSTEDDDANHFRPDYFGKDREWHHPKVDFMINHYKQSKEVLEAQGVRVVNSTVGGELEVFDRVPLRKALSR